MSTTTQAELEQFLGNSAKCPLCGGLSRERLLRAPDRFHGRTEVYTLARCSGCALVRLVDPPSPDQMPFHYGQQYHSKIEDAGESKLDRRWIRQRSAILSVKAGGALLDIGCSSGAFLRAMKGSDWQLHGIEISPEEARKAQLSSGAAVFIGDPLEAPYPSETFDVITCFHTLEHVYEPLKLLRKIHTWLKPGGILYVIVPNIGAWEAIIFGSYWYGLELPRHLTHFCPSSLEKSAQAAHLSTVKLGTGRDSFSEHSFHYIIQWLLNFANASPAPLAEGRPAALPVKIVRRLYRKSVELAFRHIAGAMGYGASVEGVFSKS